MSTEAAIVGTVRPRGHWFSKNPSKSWGEKFFLLYTPFWMGGMAFLMKSGAGAAWSDLPLLLAHLVLWTPLLVVPALVRDETQLGRKWYQTYWFKMNVWIGVFAWVGSYFLTEYFFDVLGMVYNYPHLSWNFDSALLGSGQQTVPIIMYLSAHYYFMTYHTASVILMRRVRSSRFYVHPIVWGVTVFVTAYFFAWTETFFMTHESIAQQFYYRDLPWMLRWGSWFYACYFVVSFPLVYRLDEKPEECWTLGRTCIEALAASMLVFVLLDLVTMAIGKL